MTAQIIAFPIHSVRRAAPDRDKLLGYFEEIRGKFPDHSLKRAWGMARLAVVIDEQMEAEAAPVLPERAEESNPVRPPSKPMRALCVASPNPRIEPQRALRRRIPHDDLATENLVNQMRALGSGELQPRNESEARLQQLAMKLNRRLAQLREERLAQQQP